MGKLSDEFIISYIRIEEIVGNLLYTMFWFVILKVFLDLMRPSKMIETSYEDVIKQILQKDQNPINFFNNNFSHEQLQLNLRVIFS